MPSVFFPSLMLLYDMYRNDHTFRVCVTLIKCTRLRKLVTCSVLNSEKDYVLGGPYLLSSKFQSMKSFLHTSFPKMAPPDRWGVSLSLLLLNPLYAWTFILSSNL
jgi:hypothetical protein